MAFKLSSSSAKPARRAQKVEESVVEGVDIPPKKKKSRVKEVVVIVFAIFIAISMMLPSLASIIMGSQHAQQNEAQINIDDVNKQFQSQIDKIDAKAKEDPKAVDPQLQLGLAYSQWANTVRMIAKDDAERASVPELFNKSFDAYKKAIELDGSNADAHVGYAMALFTSGKTTESIDALKSFLDSNPNNALAWSRLGAVYELDNQPEEAKKCFEKTIELDPEDKDGLKTYAENHLKAFEKSESSDSGKSDK